MSRIKKSTDSEVLVKALKVICSKGPNSFTLQDISSVVKLSPATLLQRFGTKEKLLRRAFGEADTEIHGFSKKGEGTKGLVHFLCELGSFYNSERLDQHLVLLANDLAKPKLKKTANERFNFIRERILAFLQQAQEKGELDRARDLNALVFDIEALWHGAVIQWAFLRHTNCESWIKERIESFLRPPRANKEKGAD